MSRDTNSNNKNLKWDKELIEIRRDTVFSLSSRGLSQREISTKLNISLGLVNSDLKFVFTKAKETFNTFLQEELPKEFQKALTTYDYVIKTAANTAETTHDDRIKLQALHEVREARTARMDMISNHDVMSYHVNKGKQEKEEDSQSTDSEVSEQEITGEDEELVGTNEGEHEDVSRE